MGWVWGGVGWGRDRCGGKDRGTRRVGLGGWVGRGRGGKGSSKDKGKGRVGRGGAGLGGALREQRQWRGRGKGNMHGYVRAGHKCYNKITQCNNDVAKEDNDIMS